MSEGEMRRDDCRLSPPLRTTSDSLTVAHRPSELQLFGRFPQMYYVIESDKIK